MKLSKIPKKYGFSYANEHCADHVFIHILELRKKALESALRRYPDDSDLMQEYRLIQSYSELYILNLDGYVTLPF